ncbi:MAG: hypothetical protein ACJ77D_02330 [Chloroflexota bacterium]
MRTPSPGRRIGLLFVVVSLVLAACGGGPAPSAAIPSPVSAPSSGATASSAVAEPSASARSSAQPSPRIDVVDAFRAKVVAIRTFDATIDGTVSIGATTLPAKGTIQTNGADSHQVITIMASGKPQTTETITLDGTSYARHGGVWFATPKASTSPPNSLGTALQPTIAGLTDLGSESRDGVALHRLAPPPGTTIPMSSFGASQPGASAGVMTVEFFVMDDGTPAIIALDATWTQKVGKANQPASMHLDLALDRDGDEVTITEPSPIWVTGKSKRLTYTLSYPSEWDVELTRKAETPDYYFGLDGQGFAVTRTRKCSCTLNVMTSELIRYQRQHVKGFKVVRNTTIRVAGLRARVFESHGTYPGGRSWDLTYLVTRGKYLYVLDYSSERPLTKLDRSTADQIVGSVTFR